MQGYIKSTAPGITQNFLDSSIEMNEKSNLKYESCKTVKIESKNWITICKVPDRVNAAQIFQGLEPLLNEKPTTNVALYDNVLNLIGLDISARDVQQSIVSNVKDSRENCSCREVPHDDLSK